MTAHQHAADDLADARRALMRAQRRLATAALKGPPRSTAWMRRAFAVETELARAYQEARWRAAWWDRAVSAVRSR